jgi:hypothetical protein
MNAFNLARSVEAKALVRLLPFVEEHADEGRYVLTDKGRLAPLLQETIGDVLINRAGQVWSIEIKAEQSYTGNLFLETWSNRNLDDASNHAKHGSNPGWLIKTRADLLFYYFLDTDDLFVINVFALKRWAFGHIDKPAQVYANNYDGGPKFPEKRQSKYQQLNDTLGRCVSIQMLQSVLHPPMRRLSVRQLSLQFGLEAA